MKIIIKRDYHEGSESYETFHIPDDKLAELFGNYVPYEAVTNSILNIINNLRNGRLQPLHARYVAWRGLDS
jgi:hypothetical protein